MNHRLRTTIPRAWPRRLRTESPLRRAWVEHVEHPAPALRRPMALTYEVLDRMATTFDSLGIPVRGAMARRASSSMVRDVAADTDGGGGTETFVARFDLPTTDNAGRPVPVSVLLSLLTRLYERMDGASFTEVAGVWRDKTGAFYVDLSIGVEVWTGDRKGLVAFVEEARRELGQECIPVRICRPEFIWVAEPKGTP